MQLMSSTVASLEYTMNFTSENITVLVVIESQNHLGCKRALRSSYNTYPRKLHCEQLAEFWIGQNHLFIIIGT